MIEETAMHGVATTPLSSRSMGIDTAAYDEVRRSPRDGNLGPAEAARTEQGINDFDYGDPRPTGDGAFAVSADPGACPAGGLRLAAAGAESALQPDASGHQREASRRSARAVAEEAAPTQSIH